MPRHSRTRHRHVRPRHHFKRHRISGTQSYRFGSGKPTRYRFVSGTVKHGGKRVRQRLGFKGKKKVVEVSFIPVKKS